MTKRDAEDLIRQETRLVQLGISREDAAALRRISMTLRRWFEHECNGYIQRDETTGQCYIHYGRDTAGPFLTAKTADRETGARKRLAAIMARYPGLVAYVQGDPRGCSLYVLTAADVSGQDINSVYTRGVAIA